MILYLMWMFWGMELRLVDWSWVMGYITVICVSTSVGFFLVIVAG